MEIDNPKIGHGSCENVAIQRGIPKATILGPAIVNENMTGLFAGQSIREGEMIDEYVGELLNEDESERRGTEYMVLHNYLYMIAEGRNIDGYRASSKLRFANHAGKPAYQNCVARYKFVNGIVRVGVYAQRYIEKGAESFYDCGYELEENLQGFKEKDGSLSVNYLRKRLETPETQDLEDPSYSTGNSRRKPTSKPLMARKTNRSGKKQRIT